MTLSLLSIGVATAPAVNAKIEAVAVPVAASVVADARAGVEVAVSRLGSVAAQAGGGGGESSTKPSKPVNVSGSSRGATIARFAAAQVGKGYKHGATGPSRFDCSGLTLRAAAQVGVKLPRTAAQQFGYGKRISRSQLMPGDLIFWSSKKGISHVAVSLGGNRYVAAATPRKGVVYGTIYGSPAGYRRIV